MATYSGFYHAIHNAPSSLYRAHIQMNRTDRRLCALWRPTKLVADARQSTGYACPAQDGRCRRIAARWPRRRSAAPGGGRRRRAGSGGDPGRRAAPRRPCASLLPAVRTPSTSASPPRRPRTATGSREPGAGRPVPTRWPASVWVPITAASRDRAFEGLPLGPAGTRAPRTIS